MHTLKKSAYPLALSLSALAGCVDAIGFLQLGGYFVSFMSGNSTQLAVRLASGGFDGALLLAKIVALFVFGALLGTLARQCSRLVPPAAAVLALVALLLAAAALGFDAGWDFFSIACLVLAMGAENAVFQRAGGDLVGLTYMTGTLVKVGQWLGIALLGGARFHWAPYLLLWLGLVAGGVAGTLLFHYFGLHSVWGAVLWAICLAIAACRVEEF